MNRLVSDACVPMPLQIVIDDVGWWSGRDGSADGEPFRTGIDRDHAMEDYQAIAYLGRQLGMRPQAAMILCEWDRENILRQLPTSTWMGANWDNSCRVGSWLDQAAAVIRDIADHMEFVLHGVGHEYWEGDTFTRAEWYDPDSRMRPRDQVLAHLDAYTRIMRQNDLGDFPTSFVPAAFRYGYGDGDQGLAAILRQWGITFISTPFATARFATRPQHPLMGVDQGIPTVDRGTQPPIPWDTIAAAPADIPGPILGLHWPNILHPDPAQNSAVVDRWVVYLRSFGRRFTRLLSPVQPLLASTQYQPSSHLAT